MTKKKTSQRLTVWRPKPSEAKNEKGVCVMAYGYYTERGYYGRLANGTFQLFETEFAYLDFITDN